VPQALALLEEKQRPLVVHQAGEKHMAALDAAYRKAGVQAETRAFIKDMAAMYDWADLVICRAGALTVAELAAVGVASVLVPFPHAVDDHQTHNARYLSDHGAAVLLPQAQLTAQKLAALIGDFTRDTLLDMAKKARALGKPEATAGVAGICRELTA